MRALMSILLLAAVVVAAGTFWACNDRLDDPTLSEGLLTIEKVDPAIVQAERIGDIDPNTGLQAPITDDEVAITINNRPRIPDTGNLSDVFLKKASRLCNNQNGTLVASSVTPLSFTLRSGASTSVTITAVTVGEKVNNGANGDTWSCSVQFSGEDLAGNPAKSAPAGYTVSVFD